MSESINVCLQLQEIKAMESTSLSIQFSIAEVRVYLMLFVIDGNAIVWLYNKMFLFIV